MNLPERDSAAKWIVIGILVMLLATVGWYLFGFRRTTMIQLGDTVITARIAKTDAEQVKGLAGATSLAPNEGMLFAFDKNDTWIIWMKGMKIPLDIIWLDENKKIVDIKHDATPDSYPEEKFTPRAPARYVIEVPAGFANKNRVYIGDKTSFVE